MDFHQFPNIVRIVITFGFFTAIGRSYLHYHMVHLRWSRTFPRFTKIYFLLNLTYNCFMAIGLVLWQTQHHNFPVLGHFDMNWLFVLPIIGHIAMIATRDRGSLFDPAPLILGIRLLIMIFLLPIPGKYLWSTTQYNAVFLIFFVFWAISSYHYLIRTGRNLESHFSEYTKLKAFELFPHGLVLAHSNGRKINLNPAASKILVGHDTSDPQKLVQILQSPTGRYQTGQQVYQIKQLSLTDRGIHYNLWELIDITQLVDIQSQIDKGTAAAKGAWTILQSIMDQLKQTIHQEEHTRLQQDMHHTMVDAISMIDYTFQSMEGQVMTSLEKETLVHQVDSLYQQLEQNSSEDSDHTFLELQRSYRRIGVDIRAIGSYPKNYHHRHLTYRVVKEVANIALKHGSFDEVLLQMKADENGFHFSIADKGLSLSPSIIDDSAFAEIERLVRDQHGILSLQPDNNFRIDVSLPPRYSGI